MRKHRFDCLEDLLNVLQADLNYNLSLEDNQVRNGSTLLSVVFDLTMKVKTILKIRISCPKSPTSIIIFINITNNFALMMRFPNMMLF